MVGDRRFARAAAVALLVAPLLFVVNFVANHVWPALGERYVYTIVVVLLTGTLVPCLAVATLMRHSPVDRRRWGYGFAPPDLLKITLALGLGGTIAAVQAGAAVRADPAHAALLVVWLIGPSLAEVLIFSGIVHNVVELIAARHLPQWAATSLAAGVASLAFGVYHLSHAAPWNTLPVVGTLTMVWLAVSAVFAATRSLWAAAAFNTVMATTGFIVNHVTRLDEQSLIAGLTSAVASVAVIATVLRSASRGRAAPVD